MVFMHRWERSESVRLGKESFVAGVGTVVKRRKEDIRDLKRAMLVLCPCGEFDVSEDPTDFGAFLEKHVAADPELSSLVDAAEKELAAGDDAEDYDDFHDFDEEPHCRTCCGDGWVESVAEESGRYGWDDDGPGKCPNCRGSGLLKDCSTF